MNGWTLLKKELLFKVYLHLSLEDLQQCQLVCKSWSVPAQHLLYSTIKLESPQKMIRFLKCQLQPRSIAAQFIKTLDIYQSVPPTTQEEIDIMSNLFQLLVTHCKNVEYIIANNDFSYFWKNMMAIDTDTHWKKLKCIPFDEKHSEYYKTVVDRFKHSITELTIKDDGTQQAVELLRNLAVDFPKLETLEVYDNKVIHSLSQLDNVTTHLPHLKHLCLDRGTSPTPIDDSDSNNGTVMNDSNLQSIAINIKTLNSEMIHYFVKKYTHLKRVKFVIIDTLAPQITTDDIQHLIQYCMSVSLNYQLKFSTKKPALPLDIYYNLLPPEEPKDLFIGYTVDQIQPDHYPPTFERAVIDLSKNEDGHRKNVAVYFSLYQNDRDVITLIQPLIKKVGHHLTSLTLALDPGMKFEPYHNMMHGFFLDNYIFTHCTSLKRLELGHFILANCNHTTPKPVASTSIEELTLNKCAIVISSFLYDITHRLPNLRNIVFLDCELNNLYINNGFCYDFRLSHIDSFCILTSGALVEPLVPIILDLYLGQHNRVMYFQKDANSPTLGLLQEQDLKTQFYSTVITVRLYCQSIKYLRISSDFVNVEHYFESPVIQID